MNTLVDNVEPDLTVQDALEYVNVSQEIFEKDLQLNGYLIGQLWFIRLSAPDRDKVRGGYFDPVMKDSWDDVIKTLRFLMEN